MAVWLRLLAALIALAPAAACRAGPGAAPLVLDRTIAMPGVRGRIDHLAIDVKGRRLFVAELGNDSVEAFDLARGASLGRIAGLNEPQGVAYLPARDELAVSNGGDGTVRFYRAANLAPEGRVELGRDADNLRVDTAGRLVAGFGAGALALIDPARRAIIARLDLPAHPEAFAFAGSKVFVNVPDARAIVVGDLATRRITATWPASHLENFPMAMDPTRRTLAVAFRRPPRLRLIDTASGAVKGDMETCGDADDVYFDAKRGRVYVVCGIGSVDVIDLARPERLARVATRPGARTGLFAPGLDRLYVAARAVGGEAAILVFRPQP